STMGSGWLDMGGLSTVRLPLPVTRRREQFPAVSAAKRARGATNTAFRPRELPPQTPCSPDATNLWNHAKSPICREPILFPANGRTDAYAAWPADTYRGSPGVDARGGRFGTGRALASDGCTDRRRDPGARRAHDRDPQIGSGRRAS